MGKRRGYSFIRILSNNIYALKTIFVPTPLYGISIIVEAIRHNLINFLEQTICIYTVLDAIEQHKSYVEVVKVVALFLLLDILAACISNFYEQRVKLKYLPIAQKALKEKIYDRAKSIELINYDNPTYYNEYCLVISEADKSIARAEQLLRMFFGSLTILICYGGFFITHDSFSIIFVIVSFILRTFFSNLFNKLTYDIRQKEIPLERRREYIKRVFYLKNYAKEIRLNNKITESFYDEFDEIQDNLYSLYKRNSIKRFILDFTAKYITSDFLLNVVYVVYLIIRVTVYHAISCSQIVVLYNSAADLRRGLSTVSDFGSYAVETSLYVEKIRKFLNREVRILESDSFPIPDCPAVLECCNVSFGYEKSKPILRNVNLVLRPGEKIALVGYNGAGKSTLIKLLLRLYEPTEGQILLDGKDIRCYNLNEYRNYLGVVFQDFQIYATSVKHNVVMDIKDDVSENMLFEALNKSGFYNKMLSLPRKLSTELTKEFDELGTELSGGEEQKLAMSRTFYKEAGLLVFDEPSSALDPIAEYELNCIMSDMSAERGVILISHRLSTTRRADYIYVMSAGSIVEKGTHEQLLDLGGMYCEMWKSQALKYTI